MSILKTYLKEGRKKYSTTPGDYHQYHNFDKIYDKRKGIYKYETVNGSSVVEQNTINDPEEAKKIKITKPHVVENDSTKINEEQEYDLVDNVVIPPKY